jgi:hypothetical protein
MNRTGEIVKEAILLAIDDATRVILYEGLPHQSFEKQSLEKELETKPFVKVHGYPFYTKTLNVSDRDMESLRTILSTEASYEPFSGEKRCGGFHPDYTVEWGTGPESCFVHICFGCEEFKVFWKDVATRTNIEKKTAESLRSILKNYRSERPKFVPPNGLARSISADEQKERDLQYYDSLGPEEANRPCKATGCNRGSVRFSVFCRTHHFEQLEGRECPCSH